MSVVLYLSSLSGSYFTLNSLLAPKPPDAIITPLLALKVNSWPPAFIALTPTTLPFLSIKSSALVSVFISTPRPCPKLASLLISSTPVLF